MPRVKFEAGFEADLAGPDDIHRSTKAIVGAIKAQSPTIVKAIQPVTTDASGNLGGGPSGPGAVVYKVPTGMFATMNRISLAAAGYTPAAPLTAGWITMNANGPGLTSQEMILPASGSLILPVVIVDGGGSIVLRDGESLVFYGGGLPVTLTIAVRLQIELFPVSATATTSAEVSS